MRKEKAAIQGTGSMVTNVRFVGSVDAAPIASLGVPVASTIEDVDHVSGLPSVAAGAALQCAPVVGLAHVVAPAVASHPRLLFCGHLLFPLLPGQSCGARIPRANVGGMCRRIN